MNLDLDALQLARNYEYQVIQGYKILLSFPNDSWASLTAEGKNEINEALEWSQIRLAAIDRVINEVNTLLADGYPKRVQQVAAAEVIEQFKLSLDSLHKAINEFEEPPEGILEVSSETPIE